MIFGMELKLWHNIQTCVLYHDISHAHLLLDSTKFLMAGYIPSKEVWETYCVCSVSYYYFYYYYSSSFFLSFFRQKFIRHISRRLLNGNQWNFTGMLSTMSRCADYFRNFHNGRSCHGNSQNAKKLKNTKMIIAGYSPNRNWWNLIGTTSTSSGRR